MKIEPPMRTGALGILAACFVLSAVLRAGDVVAALPKVREDGFGNRVAPAPAATDAASDGRDAGGLAEALRRQLAALDEREARLEAREAELREVEARLRARVEDLEALRSTVEAEVDKARTAARDDVRHLAEMYRNMKPREAGPIFDEMEPSFAAGFLGEIRAEDAARILASMQPARAYAVSVLLAGRNIGDTP